MKLIKLNTDHYIIVDESKQPVEGYYYDNFIKDIRNTRGAEYGQTDHCWQITHSTQPLEWFGGEIIFLSEVKELIGEVDVEKKAYEYAINDFDDYAFCGYVEGYNQALKDNKGKKWTDEDVIRIVEKSRETGLTAEYLMMTLQPKPEWEVEFDENKKLKLI